MTLDDLRLNATLADVLCENVYTRPNAEAVTDGTRRLSWRELYDAALSSCSHFAALGVRAGDRVAVVLPNQIEAVVVYWACALSGAIFVGANPRLGHDDLENILRHSGARIAVAGDETMARRVHSMRLPELRETLVVEGADPLGLFSQAVRRHPAPTARSRDDVFAICYTSGTTGRPKGAVLTHGNLVWCAARMGEALRASPDDTLLLTVGITHIFGISAGVLTAAAFGTRLVLLKTYAAGAALDLCEWEDVTIHHGTPTMFILELAAQRRAPRDLSSLRTGIVAAAPVRPELADEIRDELHCDIQIAWGLTETSPGLTMTRFGDPPGARRESVGSALPEVEIRIERDGQEYGEIAVRSPGVFRGYYNDPELTRAVLDGEGWLRTGDLGCLDDDGFLYLKGRSKEIIIRGGLHVYPQEVEDVLARLTWIESVCVIGVPDPVLGERSCACVVLRDGEEPPEDTIGAIRAAVAGRLADYKIPDLFLRVPELPRNVGGKVLKGVLRQDALARIAAT